MREASFPRRAWAPTMRPSVSRSHPPSNLESPPIRGDKVNALRGLLDRWVARTAEHLVIAMIKKGDPTAVVVPQDEYEGYLHTLELMEDEEAQAALREGELDALEGRARPYEDVRRDLGLA